MKKIYIDANDADTIHFSLISEQAPIFAKKDGVLVGMIVNEAGKGWITRLGGTFGQSGHHDNLRKCMLAGQKHGYEYFT